MTIQCLKTSFAAVMIFRAVQKYQNACPNIANFWKIWEFQKPCVWQFAHPFFLLLILEQFEKKTVGGTISTSKKICPPSVHWNSSAWLLVFCMVSTQATFPPPRSFARFWPHPFDHSQDSMSQTLIHAGDLDNDDSSGRGASWIFLVLPPNPKRGRR